MCHSAWLTLSTSRAHVAVKAGVDILMVYSTDFSVLVKTRCAQVKGYLCTPENKLAQSFPHGVGGRRLFVVFISAKVL